MVKCGHLLDEIPQPGNQLGPKQNNQSEQHHIERHQKQQPQPPRRKFRPGRQPPGRSPEQQNDQKGQNKGHNHRKRVLDPHINQRQDHPIVQDVDQQPHLWILLQFFHIFLLPLPSPEKQEVRANRIYRPPSAGAAGHFRRSGAPLHRNTVPHYRPERNGDTPKFS